MKLAYLFGATILAASCVSAPVLEDAIPVDAIQSRLVRLWSVSAERIAAGVEVSGLAARRLKPNGPVNEHLHPEAVAADGHVLQVIDVAWNRSVSLRSRKSASFNATFEKTTAAALDRVRLSVVPGLFHSEK